MKGLFITVEGADGAGKSTQAKLLTEYLQKQNLDTIAIREPGSTNISEKIRSIIIDKENAAMSDMTEVLLYAASRAQLVQEVIRPALNEGKLIVCDRFIDSSLAYQGFARGLGIDTVLNINSFALQGIQPDITFFLNLPPDVGITRASHRKALDRIEMETKDFHQKVYEGYLKLLTLYPERMVSINASADMQEVHNLIVEVINKKLVERNIL